MTTATKTTDTIHIEDIDRAVTRLDDCGLFVADADRFGRRYIYNDFDKCVGCIHADGRLTGASWSVRVEVAA